MTIAALGVAVSWKEVMGHTIAPDGLVTVTCGKADMGQHIASTRNSLPSKHIKNHTRQPAHGAAHEPVALDHSRDELEPRVPIRVIITIEKLL